MIGNVKSLIVCMGVICLFALSGCSSKPDIEGAWNLAGSTSGSVKAATTDTEFTFGPNGAVTRANHVNFGQLAMDDKSSGTYTINGSHLTVNMTSRTAGLDSATQHAMAARLHAIDPSAPLPPTQAPRTTPLHQNPEIYTFALSDNNNTLTLTPNGGGSAVALHRKTTGESGTDTARQ